MRLNFLFICCLTLIVVGCSSARSVYPSTWPEKDQCYDTDGGLVLEVGPDARKLVTANLLGECYSSKRAAEVLQKAFDEIRADAKRKNLIVFVHGRGQHPQKALKKRLIYHLEKDYEASVVMVHWPSFKGHLGYAHQSAHDRAENLGAVLSALPDVKKNNESIILANNTKLILLVHSMGNKLLENLARKKSDLVKGRSFDNLIMSAPDVPARHHTEWMDRIELAKNQYLLVNKHDGVLIGSRYLKFRGPRLGRRGAKDGVSSKFQYVNFNKTGVGHLYYIDKGAESKWKDRDDVAAFFRIIMKGEKADAKDIEGLDTQIISGREVWRFEKFKTTKPKRP